LAESDDGQIVVYSYIVRPAPIDGVIDLGPRGHVIWPGEGATLAGQGGAYISGSEKTVWFRRTEEVTHNRDILTNRGGAPSLRDQIRDVALHRLKRGDYPDTLDEFGDELERWFAAHDHHSRIEDPKASTIKGHIRDLWRLRHQWPQRRAGIPPGYVRRR
jgi:hypothetical protein